MTWRARWRRVRDGSWLRSFQISFRCSPAASPLRRRQAPPVSRSFTAIARSMRSRARKAANTVWPAVSKRRSATRCWCAISSAPIFSRPPTTRSSAQCARRTRSSTSMARRSSATARSFARSEAAIVPTGAPDRNPLLFKRMT
ncbi:hypothetical protein RHECNPAF_1740044 [Rhizobium etli CNPAF512]|nr:hypothetical protein RHECNPAF_1740044 [Rhizobium etli CNPAF512]